MQNYSVLMSVYHKEKPEYLRQAMSEIRKICENMRLSSEAFRSKAKEYIMEDRFLEYIDLYKSMHSENDGRG